MGEPAPVSRLFFVGELASSSSSSMTVIGEEVSRCEPEGTGDDLRAGETWMLRTFVGRGSGGGAMSARISINERGLSREMGVCEWVGEDGTVEECTSHSASGGGGGLIPIKMLVRLGGVGGCCCCC